MRMQRGTEMDEIIGDYMNQFFAALPADLVKKLMAEYAANPEAVTQAMFEIMAKLSMGDPMNPQANGR